MGRKESCEHCDTSGELRNNGDLFAMFIESFVDRESGKDVRERDPERRFREMASHTDRSQQILINSKE